jgi:peptidyl-prolyl cis-trans isomerase D
VLLILPSFVFFGVQGYSSFTGDQGVMAKVGKQKILQQEYDNAHRNAIERIRAQQPDADIAAIDTPALRKQTLDTLVRKYVLAEAANDQRIKAAPARLVRYFSSDPQFAAVRNPDGSPNKEMLEARGMSLAQFESLLNQELTFGQVLVGVAATGQTSKAANRGTVDALFQVREVQVQKFEAKQYVAQINPTPEQLQAFYKEPANDAWLMAPEHADVEVVALDVEWLKDKVEVSKEDVERA